MRLYFPSSFSASSLSKKFPIVVGVTKLARLDSMMRAFLICRSLWRPTSPYTYFLEGSFAGGEVLVWGPALDEDNEETCKYWALDWGLTYSAQVEVPYHGSNFLKSKLELRCRIERFTSSSSSELNNFGLPFWPASLLLASAASARCRAQREMPSSSAALLWVIPCCVSEAKLHAVGEDLKSDSSWSLLHAEFWGQHLMAPLRTWVKMELNLFGSCDQTYTLELGITLIFY